VRTRAGANRRDGTDRLFQTFRPEIIGDRGIRGINPTAPATTESIEEEPRGRSWSSAIGPASSMMLEPCWSGSPDSLVRTRMSVT
jgi:hypothetical protein